MILRRITEHVKAQNWTAVGLDFVIVVVGVFLGIQVANWNATQANKRTAQKAVESVQAELSSNQEMLRIWIDAYGTYRAHALATLDGLERPVEEWGEQFLVDAYQASGYVPITLPRDAYDDFLALGPSKVLIDEDIRQSLARYYFFLESQEINLIQVPAYRSHLRSVMPHDVENRIRTKCPVHVNILENSVSRTDTCQPDLTADQIERAVAELSAADLKPDFNLALSDMYLKIGISRLFLNTTQELDDFIEDAT
ncbi:MAG: hypothetical protein HKN14_12845 [Marinicaulis sp.]|nr:hypothetical protein [Marinicaulis sp.]